MFNIKSLGIEGVDAEKKPKKKVTAVSMPFVVDGKEIKANGETILFDIMPRAGEWWDEQAKILVSKFPSMATEAQDKPGMADDAALKALESKETGYIESAARHIAGWSLVEDGKPYPCTMENRMSLLRAIPGATGGVLAMVEKVTADLGN